MTEHKAKPEQWAADRHDWSVVDTEALHGDPVFRCIMELRDRVEALEAAQRVIASPSSNRTHLGLTQDALEAAQRPESQNPPKGTRLLSYRVENSALPIEEWGKGHTIVDSAKPPVTRDRAEDAPASSDSLVKLVADAIYMNAFGGYCEQARAAILAVADWFEQQGLYTRAARLRMEVG